MLLCAAETTDITYNTAVSVIIKISAANYDEDSSAGNDFPAAVTTMTTASIISSSTVQAIVDTISISCAAKSTVYTVHTGIIQDTDSSYNANNIEPSF